MWCSPQLYYDAQWDVACSHAQCPVDMHANYTMTHTHIIQTTIRDLHAVMHTVLHYSCVLSDSHSSSLPRWPTESMFHESLTYTRYCTFLPFGLARLWFGLKALRKIPRNSHNHPQILHLVLRHALFALRRPLHCLSRWNLWPCSDTNTS
jgi:hypothetical protein